MCVHLQGAFEPRCTSKVGEELPASAPTCAESEAVRSCVGVRRGGALKRQANPRVTEKQSFSKNKESTKVSRGSSGATPEGRDWRAEACTGPGGVQVVQRR